MPVRRWQEAGGFFLLGKRQCGTGSTKRLLLSRLFLDYKSIAIVTGRRGHTWLPPTEGTINRD